MKKGHGCLIVGHVKIGDPSENVSLHNKDYDAYYQVDPTEFAYTEFCDKIQGKKIIKTRPRTKDNAFCPMDEVVAPSVYAGSLSLMQLSGIGSMRPNIIQMGFKKYWLKSYAEGGCSGTAKADEKMKNLQDAHEHVQVLDAAMKMHFGVVLTSNLEGIKFDSFIEKKEVHVWWFAPDGGLALLLPRIMLKSKFWKRRCSKVRLFFVLKGIDKLSDDEQREELVVALKRLRLKFEITFVSLLQGGGNSATQSPHGPTAETVAAYDALEGVTPIEQQSVGGADHTWMYRWLRISELIKEHSQFASFVYATMPKKPTETKPLNWYGLIHMLCSGTPPMALIRGNNLNCLTMFQQ
jgi:sodium/chloride transporter 3